MVYLVLGVLLFAVLFAVPVAFLVWLSGAFFGSVGIAEALERTRGLAPTTYGGAFWLAVVFTGAMALLEVRAIAGGKRREMALFSKLLTRPSTALLFLFVPTFLLVRVDLKGTDVPDVLTTTALLCCLGYVYFILPLALLASSWRLARWLWRIGQRSGFASGIVGTLGLAFASCVPLVCVTEEDGAGSTDEVRAIEAAFERGFEEAEREDVVDGSRALLGALAEVIPNEGAGDFWAGVGRKDLFDECIETLHDDSESRSARSETIAYFTRRGTEADLAEQIVQESILEVCLGHARSPYVDLKKRFRWLSQQRRKNEWRRRSVWDSCAIEVEWRLYDDGEVSPEGRAEYLALNRALCSLDEVDGKILRATANGEEAATIGARLRPTMSAATVRKRRERALAKLRTQLQ